MGTHARASLAPRFWACMRAPICVHARGSFTRRRPRSRAVSSMHAASAPCSSVLWRRAPPSCTHVYCVCAQLHSRSGSLPLLTPARSHLRQLLKPPACSSHGSGSMPAVPQHVHPSAAHENATATTAQRWLPATHAGCHAVQASSLCRRLSSGCELQPGQSLRYALRAISGRSQQRGAPRQPPPRPRQAIYT